MLDFGGKYNAYRKPKLGDPVIIISEELWRYVSDRVTKSVGYLIDMITGTYYGHEPKTYNHAVGQVELLAGLPVEDFKNL